MSQSILYLMRRRPYAGIQSEEALEAALVGGVFEQNISMLFKDEGVWQLIKGQDGELLGMKSVLKTASALPEYGIEKLYVCAESLATRGIKVEELGLKVGVLTLPAQRSLLLEQQVVLCD